MPSKIRVFISSTMEDLANERQAVIEQVHNLGLEPVNAEGLLPNGMTSWNLLAAEIQDSHIFVLVLGDRYGWIPATGYGAGQNKCVTHLETELALSSGIPILPFVKKLRYGADSTSDDARHRDHFRSEIGDWAAGMFRTEFDWAIDLGQKVRKALLDVFQDTYLKTSVRNVQAARSPIARLMPSHPVHVGGRHPPSTGSILFAGAGFSIAAGYPTASALTEVLGQRLALQSSGVEILSRHPFADVAAFAEDKLGRVGLLNAVKELLDTPIPVTPTSAHFAAVQTFPVIITTNYDILFESACNHLNIDYVVHTPTSAHPSRRATVTIYKIDGSIADPESLILTDADSFRIREVNAFWSPVESILQEHRIVVVGHSMRDATSRRLLANRNLNLPGSYVSPNLDELDKVLLRRYRLEGIKMDANSYMSTILESGASQKNDPSQHI